MIEEARITKDEYSNIDLTPMFEDIATDKLQTNNTNMNLFSITKENVKSALISAFLMMVFTGMIYIVQEGSIYNIDWKSFINMVVISGLTYLISVFKNFLTDESGKFLSLWKIQ